MVNLRSAFGTAAQAAPAAAAWDVVELDLCSYRGLRIADDALHGALEAASRISAAHAAQLATCILNDLALAVPERRGPAVLGAYALRLSVASAMARFVNSRGEAHAAWQWVAQAVGDSGGDPTAADLRPERVLALIKTPHTAPLAAAALVGSLAEPLYYLARHRRYLGGVASFLAPAVGPHMHAALSVGSDVIGGAVQFAAWLLDDGRTAEATRLAATLEEMLHADPSGPHAPTLAALMTSRVGWLTSRSPADHMRWALHNLPQLTALERVAVLRGLAADAAELAAAAPEVMDAVRGAASEIALTAPDPLVRENWSTQAFNALLPVIRVLLDGGHAEDAEHVMAAWAGVPEEGRRSAPAVFAFLSEEGFCVAAPGRRPSVTSTAPTARLTRASNDALGKVLADVTGSVPASRPATDEVDTDFAEEFAQAVEEAVGADNLAEALRDPQIAPGTGSALINLATGHIPLQALAARRGAPVLPITASLAQPRPDRRVRRVQFWNTGAPAASEELEIVSEILGVTARVEEVSPQEATRERFLRAYRSSEHDVLWVAAHAGRNPYRPTEASVSLAGDDAVTLHEIARAEREQGDSRRLLVLNACGSGAVSDLGPTSRLGLAHLMAAPDQAVVANLWAVQSPAARVFAALLAAGLVHEAGFDGAFAYALNAFVQPHGHIGSELIGWRVPAVANALYEYDEPSILTWGAPAYFT